MLKYIKAEDIAKSDFSFGENYRRSKLFNDYERDGFYAQNSIVVRLRNIGSVTELLDQLAAAGATKIAGPELSMENPKPLEERAAQLALEDARRKALKYCHTASNFTDGGLEITGIESIKEDLSAASTGWQNGCFG